MYSAHGEAGARLIDNPIISDLIDKLISETIFCEHTLIRCKTIIAAQ